MDYSDPAELRESYDGAPLDPRGLAPQPMDQFHAWFTEACEAELSEPNAMVLSTVDPDGAPSARTVLLKGYDRRGLRFFTNYRSRKGVALAREPRACVVFPWHAIRRQVIVYGFAERLSDEENDAYFAQRPHGSQLGAWASEYQSAPVADRAELDRAYARCAEQWPPGTPVPRPEYWGGFLLVPQEVEFWQGRSDRMHDRFRYRLVSGTPSEGAWQIDRLSP
ncbi:pyridoxamine 5'-phosphate oxidase [Thermobifida fusca]|uniref:Pyridoxine/pyridoxamine 5'-phosphate oxidase n=1 Tax=Thermobifida fusca (strain YX) TaxID=269800 RepID=PDXH_THEFY|nr:MULTISPECIES: pyridoxamine 5'-phosphate oxidase [Thermobifida]Q47TD1.1 RecName: Full=Pyridoxine/pyridoxamine 5'-phosphate oxidase; AltName: Full=PNP/PMP oxidase; Short=PNPOx; AltName: Full=Pyridoxal 5'-phosphate synthase [Thermobifida fusca YX]AAZ54286.1 Pyridoxamine 5'-phosphate oxidase [Thermobifida fusca YX]MBO2529846.1 pyridoxine/pyridoxamine 5'-phosphate oxidase [Thermobifida sp.]MDD6790612.1 pyridoxamine 5'-phosphate oxidase [Thermobifida fusca]PPS94040.1 pyridoxine 5'-phosphate oxida